MPSASPCRHLDSDLHTGPESSRSRAGAYSILGPCRACHAPGNNNFIPGRSTIDSGVNPQELLNGVRGGQYPVVSTGSRGQPIVDFGRLIGVDASSGLPTQYGTIHSGKNGAHIVPTNPTTVGGLK